MLINLKQHVLCMMHQKFWSPVSSNPIFSSSWMCCIVMHAWCLASIKGNFSAVLTNLKQCVQFIMNHFLTPVFTIPIFTPSWMCCTFTHAGGMWTAKWGITTVGTAEPAVWVQLQSGCRHCHPPVAGVVQSGHHRRSAGWGRLMFAGVSVSLGAVCLLVSASLGAVC